MASSYVCECGKLIYLSPSEDLYWDTKENALDQLDRQTKTEKQVKKNIGYTFCDICKEYWIGMKKTHEKGCFPK